MLRDVVQWAALVVGGWMDWMIIEVSSNFSDSVILFCVCTC